IHRLNAELSSSEARFRGLFEHEPISIWEEDFSAVRQYINDLRSAGVVDFPAHFDAHPEDVAECARRVKIVDVNRATLEMYQAESKAQLLAGLSQVLGPESLLPFKEELLALLRGNMIFETEIINYTLRGERRLALLRLTIAPGYEQTWAKVFVGISNITERRQAEEALREAETKYRSLVENMPAIVYIDLADEPHNTIYINPQVQEMLGYSSEDWIAKPDLCNDIVHPEDSERMWREAQESQTSGRYAGDYRYIAKDGRVVWVHDEAVLLKNEGEAPSVWQGVMLDITAQKAAEEALRESESKLRAIFDTMSEGITLNEIIYNEKGEMVDYRILEVNQAFYSIADYSGSQVVGNLATKLYGMSPEIIKAFWETHKIRSEVQHTEYYSPLSNRSFFISTSPFVNDRFVTSFFDITELKQTEAALRQSEEKFRSLVERLPAITYISAFDEAKTRLYVSPQNEKYLGFSPAEWLADPELWRNQLHPDDHKRVLAEASHFYETGEPFISEYRTLSRDGRFVWFHDEAVIIRDADGKPQYIQGVKVNITEQKQAEEALRQSEERYRLMSWATRDAVWDWDLRAEQIWWGAGLQKIFRYPSESLQTDPGWRRDRIHENDKTKVDHTIQQALEGGMEFWSKEYRFQRLDGTYADIMDRAYILRDDSGQPYRMLGAMMDITERKQIEEIIRNQNDMLSSLYQITLDLLKHRDIDALLNAMVELSAKFLDAAFAEIMLIEGEELVVKAALKNQPALIGRRMNRDDAVLSWEAFDTRQPVVMKDYYNWPLRGAAYDEHILHAVISYPILNEDECLGVLGLGRDKPGYEFTVDQIQFGRLLANLTALVLNNAQLREALREQSIHDPLTGLFNRRYMEEVLKQHLNRVTRQHHPLGMIMVDIDHFKRFNDAHGHAAGDALLREVGRLLQNQIRVEDIACRYGGEEFLLIMPGASIAETWDRAGQLRREVKELQIEHEGRMIGEITLSAGVAVYPEHGSTQDSLMRAADAALYRAKQGGRDQAFLAESRS
ncbi:MAG TPA: PAS domain-containing protein, partial [Anaerolineales bacterium]|nr:PAS domain-containing protein [Anaerolineales bacterium]